MICEESQLNIEHITFRSILTTLNVGRTENAFEHAKTAERARKVRYILKFENPVIVFIMGS
jgi:hypothetical protein